MAYAAPLVAHVAALMTHVAALVAHVASLALPCLALPRLALLCLVCSDNSGSSGSWPRDPGRCSSVPAPTLQGLVRCFGDSGCWLGALGCCLGALDGCLGTLDSPSLNPVSGFM